MLWVGPFLDLGPELLRFATVTFQVTLTLDLAMLLGELGMPHASAPLLNHAHLFRAKIWPQARNEYSDSLE